MSDDVEGRTGLACRCGVEVGRYHYKACWLWQEGMRYQDAVPMTREELAAQQVKPKPLTNKERLSYQQDLRDEVRQAVIKQSYVREERGREVEEPLKPPMPFPSPDAAKLWLRVCVAALKRSTAREAISEADAVLEAFELRCGPLEVTFKIVPSAPIALRIEDP